MYVRPKKVLGQHFLKDENIARKIVQSLDSGPEGSILEVGPGTGVLTKYLFEDYTGVNLLEIDGESWEYLQGHFPRHKDKILLGDEISPDTCRLWDKSTNKKLDKDRFRRDLGGIEEAYQEVLRRVLA